MLSAGENFQMIIFVGNGSFRKDFRRWLLQSSGRDILRFFRSLWTYEILFLTGLFNTKEHDHQDCLRHRLITAQRYRFLFLKSQYVNKPNLFRFRSVIGLTLWHYDRFSKFYGKMFFS
ncbi:unnamed protein product [Rhizophagus irregularis]|nr:unnamed protein product [Rhizophagus irregularis]